MLNFPDVQLTVTDEACTLTSNVPLTTLASAVVGGGFQRTYTILNRYVQRNYNCADPAGDLRSFAGKDSFVGMLTGVQMRHVRVVTLRHEDLTVASVITAGVGNAMAAGVSEPVPLLPGTINVVVLIDASPRWSTRSSQPPRPRPARYWPTRCARRRATRRRAHRPTPSSLPALSAARLCHTRDPRPG